MVVIVKPTTIIFLKVFTFFMQANSKVYFSHTQCVGVKLMVRMAISCLASAAICDCELTVHIIGQSHDFHAESDAEG